MIYLLYNTVFQLLPTQAVVDLDDSSSPLTTCSECTASGSTHSPTLSLESPVVSRAPSHVDANLSFSESFGRNPIPNHLICVQVIPLHRACRKYANNKDIAPDKIVKCTLDGIEDVHYVNWIELDCAHIEAMTLKDFMEIFRKMHLPPHWQDDTCITLLRMQQDTLSFWDFQMAVQTTNAPLK